MIPGAERTGAYNLCKIVDLHHIMEHWRIRIRVWDWYIIFAPQLDLYHIMEQWRIQDSGLGTGGRLRLDVSLHNRTDVEELLRRSPYLRGRGSWTPRDCVPQHRVALIIPYRDRLEHLTTLLYTLHPLLQRQLLEYRVYVVEQYGNETFNKGVLMNAGVREALRDNDFQCFVFHDVDMIPEDDRNLLPYALLVGGVFSIHGALLRRTDTQPLLGWEEKDIDHPSVLLLHRGAPPQRANVVQAGCELNPSQRHMKSKLEEKNSKILGILLRFVPPNLPLILAVANTTTEAAVPVVEEGEESEADNAYDTDTDD
ncbi:Beta-1,4-galactosyltransferase 1 [Araneus ventricosus]|uniref:Beta-1,4-N-acetylgalactosaminyltransferase n=1 Tax=Araneus ventricosus TaxID=182803 RepID=A0A4Y2TFV4_ARAVE|nr:Beta-1,4-galactosyltransferase 1 [Araneus ventricosus]